MRLCSPQAVGGRRHAGYKSEHPAAATGETAEKPLHLHCQRMKTDRFGLVMNGALPQIIAADAAR
jgi:hypothetical protein